MQDILPKIFVIIAIGQSRNLVLLHALVDEGIYLRA